MAYPATFLDLQQKVLDRLRLDSGNALGQVKDWINNAYTEACVETEALIRAGTGTLTANSSTYSLPSDVIRIKQLAITAVGNTGNSAPLREVSLDEILRFREDGGGLAQTSGASNHYALLGVNQIELWPTPSGADTIEFYYVYRPTPLSVGTDVPAIPEPFATNCLTYGALAEGADWYGKTDDAERYRQRFEKEVGKLRRQLNRMGGSGVYQIPISPSRYPPHDPSVDWRCW